MNDRISRGGALCLAIAIALGGCVPPADEITSPTSDTKDSIVGGSSTTIQTHPWQISLQSSSGFHFCGGSILNDTWILTAAHCVSGSSPSSMRVVAGVTRVSQSSSGQIRSVAQILVFPGYSSPSSGRDAALLRLSSPLDLSGANARPIQIATPADRDAGLTDPGVSSSVTGWGTLSSGGSSPDVLQEVTVPIVSEADAEAAYNQNLTDDQIAAGLLNVGGRDSCQGDSGGPLTVAGANGGRLLAGIVSWGNGCADPDYPGMYSRVSSFASWIQSNVTVNSPPTVSISAPLGGSTVSGVVTVSANASDQDGSIARVRFTFPNGATVDDSTAPYSATWDSTTVGDGQVELRAQAIDNVGASAVASVQVITSNGNACTSGTFTAGDTPISIPDNNSTGIASSIDISGPGTVSSLALSLSIDHTWRGDLRVVLSSPNGTAYVVHDRTGGNAPDLVIQNLAISAFNNQTIDGVWTLAVQDLAGQDVGTLDSFSLSITGNCGGGGGGGSWSGSRQPNLQTRDNGSVCDSVTVNQSGDASAVRLDISGRHDYRSILRGTLAHDGVTVAAFPTGTFPRGAGTFSFTARAVAGLSGDASGVWTLCIIDTDAYGDTGVLSSWSVHN